MQKGIDLRYILVAIAFMGILFAETIDCTKVFEERKAELLKEVEKIDEARQSFEALRAATNALFDKQRESLDAQRVDLNNTMQEIALKEASMKKMLEENQKLLDAIEGAKNDKMSTTYSKMKDGAAASIIEALPEHEAAAILFTLPAKKVSTIMAKMSPQIASKITQILRKGPPFNAQMNEEEK
jgi:flagellar motility protein MotE (MotC chaperone)